MKKWIKITNPLSMVVLINHCFLICLDHGIRIFRKL